MLYFSYWHAPYEFLCLCVTDAPPNMGVECIWSTDAPSIFNVLPGEGNVNTRCVVETMLTAMPRVFSERSIGH